MLKLQEFDFEIEYIKGKENIVADFLSRMHENNALSETDPSGNDNMITHLPIKDGIVNLCKTQIIVTRQPQNQTEVLHGRRILYLDMNQTENIWKDSLKTYIISGRVGIFSKTTEQDYGTIQNVVLELFATNTKLQFVKFTKRAK